MRLRRRDVEEPPAPDPQPRHPTPEPSYAFLADSVIVVVRHTPDTLTVDPEYDIATVARFNVDGPVRVEEARDPTLRWLHEEARYTDHTEFVSRRRLVNVGASAATAEVILSLIGGAGGALTSEAVRFIAQRLRSGEGNLSSSPVPTDPEGLRCLAARALDLRSSELSLIEQRSSANRHAAVFEDREGRLYGVRTDNAEVTIRRLAPGDW